MAKYVIEIQEIPVNKNKNKTKKMCIQKKCCVKNVSGNRQCKKYETMLKVLKSVVSDYPLESGSRNTGRHKHTK